jgi:hypothetical protein
MTTAVSDFGHLLAAAMKVHLALLFAMAIFGDLELHAARFAAEFVPFLGRGQSFVDVGLYGHDAAPFESV